MKHNLPQPQTIILQEKIQAPDVKNMSNGELIFQQTKIATALVTKLLNVEPNANNDPSFFVNELKNNDPTALECFTNVKLAEFVELADAYAHIAQVLQARASTPPTKKAILIAKGLSLQEILESALQQMHEKNYKLH